MNITNWINFLLLVVSVIAAFIAWHNKIEARKYADKSNKIQKQIVAIENGRDERDRLARMQARFVLERFYRQDDCLIIWIRNIGNGTAKRVQFFADGMRINAFPSFRKTSLTSFDVTLEEQSLTTFEFGLKSYLPRPNTISITWLDELQTPQNQDLPIFER